ncbi:hypothetical protein GE21DRAFT_4916 [Neurospora crassa]|uniref:Uncharacterized protein n=1 Tax=Neurospora crassa (strain ATCC 24698 / 74-OR23-1A / CBS 708.71 / DSM 1257 / FGSC 987) TaxID=367110 RepID=U9W3I2_NEUCR|nr:hypothetical protein NCU16690 [Neurospora crassa OR74A]ESA43426.1 hypothetical protein NCU16690 [Neurospora crassa OR74A]KHE81692.1 hypothetical protein GE21DRAFT_4916 [Neurospora crassa]|eukprot:XP_011394061.1 hypothetical protein NCU16690 [Neurospora crassa OR74A]
MKVKMGLVSLKVLFLPLREMLPRLEFLKPRFCGTRLVWLLGVLSIHSLTLDMNLPEIIHGSFSIPDTCLSSLRSMSRSSTATSTEVSATPQCTYCPAQNIHFHHPCR